MGLDTERGFFKGQPGDLLTIKVRCLRLQIQPQPLSKPSWPESSALFSTLAASKGRTNASKRLLGVLFQVLFSFPRPTFDKRSGGGTGGETERAFRAWWKLAGLGVGPRGLVPLQTSFLREAPIWLSSVWDGELSGDVKRAVSSPSFPSLPSPRSCYDKERFKGSA